MAITQVKLLSMLKLIMASMQSTCYMRYIQCPVSRLSVKMAAGWSWGTAKRAPAKYDLITPPILYAGGQL